MTDEIIYDVFWEGPFKWGDKRQHNQDYVIYSLHGTHPVYGNNVLLYIGMTEVSPGKRFTGHSNWVRDEYDLMTVKLATVDRWINWEKWERFEDERYKKFENKTELRKIEALLIYAHQPAYNQVNKETAANSKGIRIFNTGKLGILLPEISYLYHIGKK